MLVTTTIILFVALGARADAIATSEDLKKLCANETVHLYSLHTIDRFVKLLEDGPQIACPNQIKSALVALSQLIETDSGNVCTMRKATAIENYYTDYLNSTVENHQPLPSSLRDFSLAYGLRVSYDCKWNMIKQLRDRVPHLVDDDDYLALGQWINKQSPANQLLGGVGNPDDIFLPSDLGLEPDSRATRAVPKEIRPLIQRLQSVCQNRFRPVYEPLLLPLAKLANLGFNHRDKWLKKALALDNIKTTVYRWSRIVFFCETLTLMKLSERKEANQGQSEEMDAEATESASTESEPALNQWESEALEKLLKKLDRNIPLRPPIEYNAEFKVSVDDNFMLPPAKDAKIESAISAFRTSRSVQENARTRLSSNFVAVLRNKAKQLNFISVFKLLHRKLARNLERRVGLPDDQTEFLLSQDQLFRMAANTNPEPYREVKSYYNRLMFGVAFGVTALVMCLILFV